MSLTCFIKTLVLHNLFIFPASRWRWSLPLLIGLLLMCLTILGAYFIQGVLKGQLSLWSPLNINSVLAKDLNVCSVFLLGYVWRWLKEDDVKGMCKPDIHTSHFRLGNHYFLYHLFIVYI